MNVETKNEFVARMDCGHVYTGSGNDVIQLFANGGRWQWHHGLDPPPEGSAEMRSLKFQYARAKLKNMVLAYRRTEQNASMQNMFHSSGNGPPADPAAIEWLTMFAPKVEKQQEIVEKLREELQSKAPSAPHITAHDRRREECRQASSAMAQQLAALPRF